MMSVTVIDKTDPKDPTKRENYWIDTLENKAALELSFQDRVQYKLYFAPRIVFCFMFMDSDFR